jgi:hypothetical protein
MASDIDPPLVFANQPALVQAPASGRSTANRCSSLAIKSRILGLAGWLPLDAAIWPEECHGYQ